jgi:hypothetical protein
VANVCHLALEREKGCHQALEGEMDEADETVRKLTMLNMHVSISPPRHNMYTILFIHPGLEHQLWYGRSSPQS